MKKKALTIAGAVLVTLFTGVLFAGNEAFQLKNSGTSIDSVIQLVENQKLTNIKSIEFDDGQWEVKTLSKNIESKYLHNVQPSQAATTETANQQVENTNNAQTVAPVAVANSPLTLVKQERENDLEPPMELASLKNAVKVVQDKGYNVYSVDYEGNCWEVEAYDSKNLEYTILVNVADGKILNTKLDD